MEQAITEMPEPIREPLKHSYLGRGDDKQKARDLELSVRTFYVSILYEAFPFCDVDASIDEEKLLDVSILVSFR